MDFLSNTNTGIHECNLENRTFSHDLWAIAWSATGRMMWPITQIKQSYFRERARATRLQKMQAIAANYYDSWFYPPECRPPILSAVGTLKFGRPCLRQGQAFVLTAIHRARRFEVWSINTPAKITCNIGRRWRVSGGRSRLGHVQSGRRQDRAPGQGVEPTEPAPQSRRRLNGLVGFVLVMADLIDCAAATSLPAFSPPKWTPLVCARHSVLS